MAAENNSEMACVLAALMLHDDSSEITEDKISNIVKTAGVEIEPYWAGLFAKLLEKTNVDDLIGAIGSAPAPGAAAGGGGAAGGGDAPAEEEKKEESEEEEEEDMDFDLFD